MCTFAKQLILCDPQELFSAAKLIQENRYELEYLVELIQWRLKLRHQEPNELNVDNQFYWRILLPGNNVPAEAEQQEAERQRAEAERQRRIALAQSLAALAPRIIERTNDTELATLLSLEAEDLNRDTEARIQELVDSSLRDVLSEPYFNTVLSGRQGSVVFVKRKCQHFLIENDVTDRVKVANL